MYVIAHGIDLVDITEMKLWIDDPRDPLIPRCFTQQEIEEVGEGPNRVESLAGRYAAKEAVLKALGTGFGGGVAFTDVLIHRAPGKPPKVRLTGGAADVAAEQGITDWLLSISHTGPIAMASAIAFSRCG